MFKTIEWKKTSVIILDQTELPTRVVYRRYSGHKPVAKAIKDLLVRGAPLIGVTAAMGIALGAYNIKTKNKGAFKKEFKKIARLMARTRPTAINLFWAIRRMEKVFDENIGLSIPKIKKTLIAEAKEIHREDIEINRRIGRNGARLIKNGSTVLTHCNAGALATGGYGTALGVIRGAMEAGKKLKVFACETRPVLQGARLTSWELVQSRADTTLITDNMAGVMMKNKLIDCVIVGADRIIANGDTANKIGTYSLSVLAHAHKIPFYVAAPLSTFDMKIKRGSSIPIEERPQSEVTHIKNIRIAPRGVKVKNPAFDVTPHGLISAIITEKGIIRPTVENIKKLFKGEN